MSNDTAKHLEAGAYFTFLRAILEKLKTTEKYVSPTELAILYIALGDKEKAFELFEKSYAERDVTLTSLKVEPGYDPIRNDPRFQDLLKRVGLSQ